VALILRGKTECSICGSVIKDEDEIVAATHFIRDPDDPLWRFSDSAMHKACFLEWHQRGEFVKRYNETVGAVTWGNGTYHHMEDDGSISVLRRDSET